MVRVWIDAFETLVRQFEAIPVRIPAFEKEVKKGKPAMTCRFAVVALLVSRMAIATLGQTRLPASKALLVPGRLTIVNRQHQQVPEERARILLLTTCHVVAEEFHRHPNEVDLRLTLVLGSRDVGLPSGGRNEGFTIDKGGGLTLYLDRWNEGKFVDSVISGAMEQLTPLHIRKEMLKDILRRSDLIAPVSVNGLKDRALARPSPGLNLGPDCMSAVRGSPCPWPNQAPSHP